LLIARSEPLPLLAEQSLLEPATELQGGKVEALVFVPLS
jgi:hypothetical protein